MNRMVHVYECEECILTFAVEQEFEDQSGITCPNCQSEESVRDVGKGVMTVELSAAITE